MFRHQLFVDTSNYETHNCRCILISCKGKVEIHAANLRWKFLEKLDHETSGDVKILWALADPEYQWKMGPVFHNMRSIALPKKYKKCSSAHIRRIETNDTKSVEGKILGILIYSVAPLLLIAGNCARVTWRAACSPSRAYCFPERLNSLCYKEP